MGKCTVSDLETREINIFHFGKKICKLQSNFRRLIKKSSCSRHKTEKGAGLNKKTDVDVKLGTSIGAPPHMGPGVVMDTTRNLQWGHTKGCLTGAR